MTDATTLTYGASVRGPRNRQANQRNQDAWLHSTGSFGDLVVVCDGLGSRAESRAGADAACRAVKKAAGHWPGCAMGARVMHLLHLVEVLWRFELGARPPSDCATTCSFALREPSGHVILAGLGDGLTLVLNPRGEVRSFGGREEAFGNETLALGASHRLDDWWFETLPPEEAEHIVLATDGVADDLDPGRLDDFVATLTNAYGSLEASARWRALCAELRDWPVPHHVDDKTLAILTVKKDEEP